MKYQPLEAFQETIWSLPVRGAWIEMYPPLLKSLIATVAPRAGSVD